MYKKDKDSPLASLVINHKKLHKITCDPNIPEHIFFLLHFEIMSALVLQNNILWPIFEDFTPSILLSAFFLIYVIRNKFSNDLSSRDNKITNELSACISEINVNLTAKIKKNKTHGGSIIAEIEKTFIEMNKKFSIEVSTKITNEFSARFFEVNFTFIAKLVKNNNELNKKLTGEIKNFKARDADYVTEA